MSHRSYFVFRSPLVSCPNNSKCFWPNWSSQGFSSDLSGYCSWFIVSDFPLFTVSEGLGFFCKHKTIFLHFNNSSGDSYTYIKRLISRIIILEQSLTKNINLLNHICAWNSRVWQENCSLDPERVPAAAVAVVSGITDTNWPWIWSTCSVFCWYSCGCTLFLLVAHGLWGFYFQFICLFFFFF